MTSILFKMVLPYKGFVIKHSQKELALDPTRECCWCWVQVNEQLGYRLLLVKERWQMMIFAPLRTRLGTSGKQADRLQNVHSSHFHFVSFQSLKLQLGNTVSFAVRHAVIGHYVPV